MYAKQRHLFGKQKIKILSDAMNPTYLDCNSTTPLEPAVRELFWRYLTEEFGNEGSRTHEYGARAKQAVQRARDQVAAVVQAKREEVIFTSGATESNNLAILGLAAHGMASGRKHLIGTRLEHKAVLEPLDEMERQGFSVTLLNSDSDGRVRVEELAAALRPDTLLVSVMAANNETGVRQPMQEICHLMGSHEAYLHSDAAQLFGKELDVLRNPRIDLISVSGHKIFAPQGIGTLVSRRRGYERAPLQALLHGGGQERGIRPGTLPVAPIVALGAASELAVRDGEKRRARCREIKELALSVLGPLGARIHGRSEDTMDHVVNLAFPGIDSEALIVALKNLVAISNGSACTSSSYTPSHVIKAMGYGDDEANEAVRLSWCHLTGDPPWEEMAERIRMLR